MNGLKPPFSYFGGKTSIASQIAALLPPHEHYVEPFAGSLAVLLAKPPSKMETVSDLDGDLVNFWRVLRERPQDLERVCALTPHSRAEYVACYEPATDDLERARRVWVNLTQGRGGQMRRTGWRYYADPSGGASMPSYLGAYVARLMPAAERLSSVSLECLDALDIIGRYGSHPGAQRRAATWTMACHARSEADFRLLCEVAGLDVSHEALTGVLAANRE